jgi:hypothetical protein
MWTQTDEFPGISEFEDFQLRRQLDKARPRHLIPAFFALKRPNAQHDAVAIIVERGDESPDLNQVLGTNCFFAGH